MSKDEEFGEFWKIIHDEYILTKKMLLKISSFNELMENEPANKLSIQTRENVVMPSNYYSTICSSNCKGN